MGVTNQNGLLLSTLCLRFACAAGFGDAAVTG